MYTVDRLYQLLDHLNGIKLEDSSNNSIIKKYDYMIFPASISENCVIIPPDLLLTGSRGGRAWTSCSPSSGSRWISRTCGGSLSSATGTEVVGFSMLGIPNKVSAPVCVQNLVTFHSVGGSGSRK